MKLISPYLQQPAKSDAVEFGKWLLLNYGDINGLNIDVLYNEYYLPENNTNPISKH